MQNKTLNTLTTFAPLLFTLSLIGMLFGYILLHGLFTYWDRQDQARELSASRYEACISTQYNTTPARYANTHDGNYPVCSQ